MESIQRNNKPDEKIRDYEIWQDKDNGNIEIFGVKNRKDWAVHYQRKDFQQERQSVSACLLDIPWEIPSEELPTWAWNTEERPGLETETCHLVQGKAMKLQ